MIMKLSANIAIPNVVISPTKRIMSLNKRKNVMRITAKNVTLSTKMWPRMKKFNFVSPLWSEIVTFRDRQNVPLNTDPSVPPDITSTKWKKIVPNAKRFTKKNARVKPKAIPLLKNAPNGQSPNVLWKLPPLRNTLRKPTVRKLPSNFADLRDVQ